MTQLTEIEKRVVDAEVADVLLPIKLSPHNQTMKLILAFQAGVEYAKKKIRENSETS